MALQLLLLLTPIQLPYPPILELSPGSPSGRGFGIVVAGVGDVDQDGAADIAVGDREPEGKTPDPLWVFSGRDGRLLFHDPEVVLSVAAAGDVDADGVPDILVGGGPGGRVLSGRDGKKLLELTLAQSIRPGLEVDGLGDTDGDGFPELMVVGGLRLGVFSGRDGALVRSLVWGREWTPKLEADAQMIRIDWSQDAVRVIGDVDADGHRDIALPSRYLDRDGKDGVTVVSSVTFRELLQIRPHEHSSSINGRFGDCVASAGDFDRDGRDDVLVSAQDNWVGVYSGATGGILRTFREVMPGGYFEGFGATVAALGDSNRDGWPEVAVGCAEIDDSGDFYYAAVFDGRSSAPLRTLQRTQPPGVYHGVYHLVSAVGDVDRDGIGDLAVAAWEEGIVWVLSGRDFEVRHELRRPSLAR